MPKFITNLLAVGLVAGITGFAVYFFGFGQTFEGEVSITPKIDRPGAVGMVTFQSRFRNRRFLTHSMVLDLMADTPTTYQGEPISPSAAVERFADDQVDARVGYREEKSGWGYTVSLDLEPPGISPKEILLVSSLLLIFGCTAGMALVAKSD